MTWNDEFDVISVQFCLHARRAEGYKQLVPQICEPTDKEWGGSGSRVQDENTMSAMLLHRLARAHICNVKQPEVDFENLLLDSDIQGYLYEPEYCQEELTQIEEEAAATAAEQALPVAEDVEPKRPGLLCSPIDTKGTNTPNAYPRIDVRA